MMQKGMAAIQRGGVPYNKLWPSWVMVPSLVVVKGQWGVRLAIGDALRSKRSGGHDFHESPTKDKVESVPSAAAPYLN